MKTQDLRRIIIYGETASSVHGTGLRERVEEEALNLGIKGQIRNVKGLARVEVICCIDDPKKFNAFRLILEGFKGRADNLFKIRDVRVEDSLFDVFDSFNVVREDDLSEMVWALQAAGKVFGTNEKLRQAVRKKSMLGGLESCITLISIHNEELISSEECSAFHLFVIEHFLKEPPKDVDENFIRNLWDLYATCKNVNDLIESGKNKADKRFSDNTMRIKAITSSILAAIDKVK